MPLESDWNMALDTLYRISQGIHRCNDAMHQGDYLEWLKAIYHFYGELSTWLTIDDQADIIKRIDRCRQYPHHDFEDNLHHFFLTTQALRRHADHYGLLIKEKEDTLKHGG